MCGKRAALMALLTLLPTFARADIEVRLPASEPRTFTTSEWDGAEYVTADDVSLIYSASLYWRPELQKMTLRLGDFHVKVTAENPNVVIEERVIHLAAPVLFRDGHLQLPLDLVTDILPDLCPYPVIWRPEARLLTMGAPGSVILDVTRNTLPNGIELIVRPSGPADFVTREQDGVIQLVFPGSRVLDEQIPMIEDDPFLLDAQWVKNVDTLTFVVARTDSVIDYQVTREGRPERIVIRLSAVPLIKEQQSTSGTMRALTSPSGRTRQIGRVVIDAGHGGADTGYRSGALVEKDVTLDIAKHLGRVLEEEYGIAVVYTREGDEEITAERRTEIANEAQGDLLISLHVNASTIPALRGTEVYVHSPGIGVSERIERIVEEATTRYRTEVVGGLLDQSLRMIPWDAVQTGYKKRSGEVARSIQRSFTEGEDLPSRGVKQGPIGVLAGADMPAVLVEFGFGSSRDDMKRLIEKTSRERLAEQVARAIKEASSG